MLSKSMSPKVYLIQTKFLVLTIHNAETEPFLKSGYWSGYKVRLRTLPLGSDNNN